MSQELSKVIIEKTKEILNAPTSCEEVKAAAQSWLDAIGTDVESEETKKYFQILEESIVSIDDLISLACSEKGVQYFGAEIAQSIGNHAKEIKSAGAKYCDCPACAAVAAILEIKDKAIQ